ncbi:hypothetical protein CLV30_103219 [Haloactinopolyspora alba]|uniref:Uncharacterized protein n=1 Tax=Haloactinopolyspora alba TaxID=648780 RepID=A0A2P8E9D8_9ACTN|nr:hypothetical protein CLV30_103219 [Haloactinopolyspora alba]
MLHGASRPVTISSPLVGTTGPPGTGVLVDGVDGARLACGGVVAGDEFVAGGELVVRAGGEVLDVSSSPPAQEAAVSVTTRTSAARRMGTGPS